MLYVGVLAFLGLIVGLVVARLAKGELVSGKKYFVFLYKVVIFILLLLSLYFAWFAQIPHLILGFLAGLLFHFGVRNIYFYLGGLFILSFFGISENYFYIVSTFIFILGILRGGLLRARFSKNSNIINGIFLSLIWFGIPFFMIFYRAEVLTVDPLIYSFISGAIFMEFIKKIRL